jgi:hypothetical protein
MKQHCVNVFKDLFQEDVLQQELAKRRSQIIDLCSRGINEPHNYSTYGEVFDGWHFVPPSEGNSGKIGYRRANMRDGDSVFLEVGSCFRVD